MSNKIVKFKGRGLLRSNSWKLEMIGTVALWKYERFMSLKGWRQCEMFSVQNMPVEVENF